MKTTRKFKKDAIFILGEPENGVVDATEYFRHKQNKYNPQIVMEDRIAKARQRILDRAKEMDW